MRYAWWILILCGWTACSSPPLRPVEEPKKVVQFDLDSILDRGTLRVITENTSTSYFLYRGQPMGFDYDLLKAFAGQLGVELEVIIKHSPSEMFEALDSGEGDVIACNLTITEARQKHMLFSDPVDHTRMVVVQHIPEEAPNGTRLQSWDQLAGKTVVVHPHSSFYGRLEVLNRDSALGVIIEPADTLLDSETLIAAVADGLVPLTVADDNMARVNRTYHSGLNIEVPLGPLEPVGYAMRTTATALKDTLNAWLAGARVQRKRNYLARKYFDSPKQQHDRAMSDYSSLAGGRISPYDETIQQEAERLGWDWRLLAALIYHESRFNPQARSWAGASGLMQLMPGTAVRFGVDSTASAAGNIHAGVSYLKYLDRFWEKRIADPEQRTYFILASYNVGPGHVLDAQCLAEMEGLDPNIWFDQVETMLARKSESEFYRRECVEHGYCRGTSATRYVRNIAGHYRHYASILDKS